MNNKVPNCENCKFYNEDWTLRGIECTTCTIRHVNFQPTLCKQIKDTIKGLFKNEKTKKNH